MRRPRTVLMAVVAIVLILTGAGELLAQVSTAPLLLIHGRPDTRSSPPEVRTYVSVIQGEEARSVDGLDAGAFALAEHGIDITEPVAASYERVGLAVVIVVDRGGISAPGDARIKDATALGEELVDKLYIRGADQDDIAAIVGVGQDGVLAPSADFSYQPVDANLVKNALIMMHDEAVRGGTPLYEGLDEALRLLLNNPTGSIRDVLEHRRKIIVVFSDGIDPNFSDEVREGDIATKARENGVSIYTVGMNARSGERNLIRLASQTYGVYTPHINETTRAEVLGLFDRLVTQSQQYVLTYDTHLSKGEHVLGVTVTTPGGESATRSANFSSVLVPPSIALTEPGVGTRIEVPYSEEIEGYAARTITLRLSVEKPFGAFDPPEVEYFVAGTSVGKSSSPPDYPLEWDASTRVTPSLSEQTVELSLEARATDRHLADRISSPSVNIIVVYGAQPPPPPTPTPTVIDNVTTPFIENWPLVILLVVAFLGLVVLFILGIKMKSDLGRKVATRATGVIKGVTRALTPLGAGPQAPGKLVIVQGANIGKEFRISGQVVKVGREPQFCDFALYDEFVSNPHFSIYYDTQNFFIQDDGSRNRTRVNGQVIPPNQRIPIQPDTIIEVGSTRLQFKRLGGATRQLSPISEVLPGGAPPPAGPQSGHAAWNDPTIQSPASRDDGLQSYPPPKPEEFPNR